VGAAISRRLAARGARVIVHHHASADAARALAAELDGALALAADLAAADGPSRLLATCAEAGALPDAIVHSAASFLRRPVADTSAEDWDAVFALNLRAFFLLARDFARRHGPAGKGAPAGEAPAGEPDGGAAADRCLIALSDSGAYELWTGYAAHCVAKAALLPLVQVLAKALAPAVRVNAVIPGPVLPEPGTPPERRQAMADRTLVGRLGEPDDVARAVCFLLENPFTTGTLLEVTGGAHLWRR
jgi:pteridine reductase